MHEYEAEESYRFPQQKTATNPQRIEISSNCVLEETTDITTKKSITTVPFSPRNLTFKIPGETQTLRVTLVGVMDPGGGGGVILTVCLAYVRARFTTTMSRRGEGQGRRETPDVRIMTIKCILPRTL
ncbi:hypothetical protein J6590_038247 [Homalodisca vitripennis]|nr:hypothetical protein J6590_038247 [Homalodisca vitripennis]